jgi:gamma-glutamyl hydrolase
MVKMAPAAQRLVIAVAAALVCAAVAAATSQPEDPIVGILSQPNVHSWANQCNEYVQTTYVDWFASTGVRAVPVHYDLAPDALAALLGRLNGVLFTGGGLGFREHPTFYNTAQAIYNYTVAQNAAGNPFVLWGTCQGFQLISTIASNSQWDVLECGFTGVDGAMLPLSLVPDAVTNSRLFAGLTAPTSPQTLLSDITTRNTTANLHVCGVAPATWNATAALNASLQILSTNVDATGRPFVSSFQHRSAEIYGTQWHPEAAQFWYLPGLTRDPATIRVSTFASAFLTSRLRRVTRNRFAANDDSWKKLLLIDSNWPVVDQPASEVTGFFCVGSRNPRAANQNELTDLRRRRELYGDLLVAGGILLIAVTATAAWLLWEKRHASEGARGYGSVIQAEAS